MRESPVQENPVQENTVEENTVEESVVQETVRQEIPVQHEPPRHQPSQGRRHNRYCASNATDRRPRSLPAAGRRLATVLPILLLSASLAAASPLVIAHRGASGYLPEHTLEAYAFAYAQGADFVEPDLVLTRDGRFICLHDIHLEATTDVATRFPDRAREDGRYYAIDFDLAEIRTLRARERLDGRFPQGRSSFQVPTLEEMVELVQGLNRTTGRDVGIYPELKQPAWHRQEGKPMEEAFLELVRAYGYRGPDARIFVQSFELEPLRRMRDLGSELPQVFLLATGPEAAAATTEEALRSIAEVANGFGPSKMLLIGDPTLTRRAQAAGLAVHPWTFRADDVAAGWEDVDSELRHFLFELGVDGVFTDFPDRALRVRAEDR